MRVLARFGLIAVSTFVLSGWGQAKADSIIGNIPPTYTAPTYNTNGLVGLVGTNNYGIEFQAGANETATQATLILSFNTGATPTLGIYTSATPAAGSLVGSLTLTSPNFGTAQSNTFTGNVPLTSGSNYFLILALPSTSGSVSWSATSTTTNTSGLTPIGPGASYVAAGGTATGGSYAAGNTKTSFELDTASGARTLIIDHGFPRCGVLGRAPLWSKREDRLSLPFDRYPYGFLDQSGSPSDCAQARARAPPTPNPPLQRGGLGALSRISRGTITPEHSRPQPGGRSPHPEDP